MKKTNLIAIITALFFTFVIGMQPVSANTNHLLVLNTKKNTMGYYVNYKMVRTFKIASGKPTTPTPIGKTKIVNKIKNRPYYTGGIPGGSPNNPLGDRWLGLPLAGTLGNVYAIHGNNNSSSIGKHVSGGCVRMYNDEVRWLFDQIPIGTDVIIKYTDQTDNEIAKGYGINLNIKNPGWYKENNKWYYVTEQGEFYKNGWKKISDKWYYFETDGAMRTGWKKISDKWYYFETDGAMRTGWKKISDKWYYFETDGAMRTGWKKISDKWYYFETDGAMRTGWKKISDKWYYFETDGAMRTGWKKISDKWYYFETDGSMKTNTTIDGWIIDSSGVATQK